ncbi:class I SAM-dependent methyltransferase [Fulvivirga lutea]|uniref:Class I SAM-dependent methyltransferase n=1 Tax=Fulvivirga lutea TaxID=2810512 RepID=A0A974WFR6_9BACT|nr:class I SAM-dependent methyltransferase [Fulvivirga lutea]QSE97185.1 class I SAM-dependent methyltransferase [Fulvivirga lutea]
MPKKAICAEIGAWKGDFTSEILRQTKPKKLYIIDPYLHVETYDKAWYGGLDSSQEKMDEVFKSTQQRFENELYSGQLEFLRDDSTKALDKFEDDHFDWIYIDGNHLYEYVKLDLENSFKKVKSGGYITGDDYNLVGWWDDGVTKAVNEFIENFKDSITVISIKGTQFILRKN